MRCDEAEKCVLLGESGELSGKKRCALDEHLSACAGCRAFLGSTRALLTAAESVSVTVEPGAAVMSRLRAAASDRIDSGRTRIFPRLIPQALAYAALFMLVVGIWSYHSGRQRLERIGAVHTLLSVLAQDESATHAFLDQASASQGELSELADRLLRLEGLAGDEIIEVEPLEIDPTGPLSRSIGGFLPRKCG